MAKQTATQLRDKVTLNAGDQSTNGETRALNALNKAQAMLVNYHKWSFLKRTGDLTLTALTREYVITSFTSIDEPYGIIYFHDDYATTIKAIDNEEEWWSYYDNDSDTGSYPGFFRFFNSQIEFNSVPSSSFVTNYSPVKVLYRILPTDLSTSTDNSTDFPERFEEILIDLATQITLGNQEDFGAMQFFEREVGRQLIELKKRDILKYRNSFTVRPRISSRFTHSKIWGNITNEKTIQTNKI